jgi:uncharacterized Zn finger protein
MGISTNCGLMIGLPYKEFIEALNTSDDSIEEFEEFIDHGELDIGSIYYDSPRDENIVGKWLINPNYLSEITLEKEKEFLKISNAFKEQYPDIEFKIWLTNCVW